jgi:endonuclease/exonuclease/phosphatase family metal-dependent hydrolase
MKLRTLAPLVLLLPAAVLVPGRGDAASPTATAAAAPTSPIRVAVANVHEGSLVRHRADRRDGTDRRVFVNRLLARRGALPDVVLLQEVLGSAGILAHTLNAHPRVRRAGGAYRVAGGTFHRRVAGRCDGPRAGRFSLLRSSAVLVNSRTVKRVPQAGAIRTWGRWHRRAWGHTGRKGYGCTEHPWARVVVQRQGTAPSAALVVSTHVAPVGGGLKTRAIRVVRATADSLHRGRVEERVVIGGDLNLNRCGQPVRTGELAVCPVRAAHRSLLDAGYRDAVRQANPVGPHGVVGVAGRIDFVYVKGGDLAGAWYDRCYRAYLVRRWSCGSRAVFTTQRRFNLCQSRSLRHGRPGRGCRSSQFRRYYSDHPVLLADLR